MRGPKCPNHEVPLVDLPFPMKPKGEGTCPISKCRFDYEVEMDESKFEDAVDKFGNKIKLAPITVTGDER